MNCVIDNRHTSAIINRFVLFERESKSLLILINGNIKQFPTTLTRKIRLN